jgi:hypothetical protein
MESKPPCTILERIRERFMENQRNIDSGGQEGAKDAI